MYTIRTGFVILLSPVYFGDWVIEIRHFSPLKTNNRAQLRTAWVKPVLRNCCKQSNNEIDLPINVWVVNVVAEKLKTIKNDASAINMKRRRSIWRDGDKYDAMAIKNDASAMKNVASVIDMTWRWSRNDSTASSNSCLTIRTITWCLIDLFWASLVRIPSPHNQTISQPFKAFGV